MGCFLAYWFSLDSLWLVKAQANPKVQKLVFKSNNGSNTRRKNGRSVKWLKKRIKTILSTKLNPCENS